MHANDEYSRYDRLTPKVEVGQAVGKGQQIAKVEMTGYTFSPHLHFIMICSNRLMMRLFFMLTFSLASCITCRQNLDESVAFPRCYSLDKSPVL
jgi:murein DD-endopeptidase MepM/ murein hydrolase activator NlpD